MRGCPFKSSGFPTWILGRNEAILGHFGVFLGQDLLRSLLPDVLRALQALIDADEVRILGPKTSILVPFSIPCPKMFVLGPFRGHFGANLPDFGAVSPPLNPIEPH